MKVVAVAVAAAEVGMHVLGKTAAGIAEHKMRQALLWVWVEVVAVKPLLDVEAPYVHVEAPFPHFEAPFPHVGVPHRCVEELHLLAPAVVEGMPSTQVPWLNIGVQVDQVQSEVQQGGRFDKQGAASQLHSQLWGGAAAVEGTTSWHIGRQFDPWACLPW